MPKNRGEYKLVLSIDGGGVRGKFDLEIIHYLELALQQKIYDVFDLVVGVSAGAGTAGLIATKKYTDIREIARPSLQAFADRQSFGPMFGAKYGGQGKTTFLNDLFGHTKMGEIAYPVGILTATIDGDPVVYKSWSKQQRDVRLASVVDASTAAPIYFPPVKIEDRYYIDGGTVSNDPVVCGISLARELWGQNTKVAVLSLGTGKVSKITIDEESPPRQFGLVKWLMEGLIDILTRSNDQLAVEIIPQLIGKGNYFRVTSTVTGNLDDVSDNMQDALTTNAKDIWRSYGKEIVEWILFKKQE